MAGVDNLDNDLDGFDVSGSGLMLLSTLTLVMNQVCNFNKFLAWRMGSLVVHMPLSILAIDCTSMVLYAFG